MARIIGIDYGTKRTGIAVTDELQIAVHPLKTVNTYKLLTELTEYLSQESVEKIVFGQPFHADGSETYLSSHIKSFSQKIKELYPNILVDFQDESFTSVEAKEILLKMGVKKKARREKERVDLMSAVLILQKYLKHY